MGIITYRVAIRSIQNILEECQAQSKGHQGVSCLFNNCENWDPLPCVLGLGGRLNVPSRVYLEAADAEAVG